MLNLIKFSQYFRGGKLVTRGGEIPGLPPPLNETLMSMHTYVLIIIISMLADPCHRVIQHVLVSSRHYTYPAELM